MGNELINKHLKICRFYVVIDLFVSNSWSNLIIIKYVKVFEVGGCYL